MTDPARVRIAHLGVFLLLALACAPAPPRPPRVLLIGIDGADPEIVDRLAAEGRLPAFARLRSEGAYGRLRSREPLLSPLVWTTIATGRTPQDHGVLDFVEVDAAGATVPITGSRRRVPALWDVATEHGVASGFVGWYATFPAARVRGFQVSDRIAFHQVRSARAAAGVTHPEALAGDLRQRFGEPAPDLDATRRRFLDDPEAAVAADGERRLRQLAEIRATAELYRRAVPYLAERFHPDLLAVYFELVDACGHLFMEDAPPRRPEVTDVAFAAFAGTVDRCYEYQDGVLGELLALAGPETVTLVVSDHGFKYGEVRPRTSGRADTGVAGLWHRLHGVIFLHGRGVRPGAAIEGAGVLDVAPTVLALLGLPLSGELPGRPLADAFTPGLLPPVRRVDHYRWSPPGAAPAAPATGTDDAALRKLRALGYLGASTAAPAHDAAGRTAESFVNEGTARSVDGDVDGAFRAFSTALGLDSENLRAMTLAARLYTGRGELEAAARLLDRARGVSPHNLFVLLESADLALHQGDWSLARRELAAVEALDDRVVQVHVLKARLANATGNPEVALAELERAESLTGAETVLAEIVLFRARVAAESGRIDVAEAALGRAAGLAPPEALAAARGDLALALGRYPEAVSELRRAVEASPRDATLERKLGQALGANDEPDGAEKAFRRAIAKAANAADRAGAWGDLALLLQRSGQDDRTLEVLLAATREVPGSASLWGLLGAAYGRAGDLDAALPAYERSIALEATPLALNTLAALVFDRWRDRARAVELWRRSLALDPDQPEIRAFLQAHGK